MIAPDFPLNEKERQKAVERYRLLDTLPEESYDNITSLMSHVCDTPISLITLLDKERNFLKSHHGIPFNESPREISFCGHAINSEDSITIIEDARLDERFHDNPLVSEHNAVFYAGVPLVNPDGFKLGTLCVYDVRPRKLTEAQKDALLNMARQVMRLFEERYKNYQLETLREKLEQRNQNLEKFAGVVSHDLKSPLAQIKALTELLEQDIQGELDAETKQYIEYIKDSSTSLSRYIDGMLKYYKAEGDLKQKAEWIEVTDFLKKIENMFKGERNAQFISSILVDRIYTNRSSLAQVFVNLISNALKYNNKNHPVIEMEIRESVNSYHFSVSDNGMGIPKDKQSSIFELFSTVHSSDKAGEVGTGIGLATVKKVVDGLNGTIEVHSEVDKGTTFTISIPK